MHCKGSLRISRTLRFETRAYSPQPQQVEITRFLMSKQIRSGGLLVTEHDTANLNQWNECTLSALDDLRFRV